MLLTKINLDLGNSRLYTIDYTEWLLEGETIVSTQNGITPVTTPPLVVTTQLLNTQQVSLLIEGGAEDEVYTVVVQIETNVTLPGAINSGQTRNDCIEVNVRGVCGQ